MYCSHCGNEVLDKAVVCPKCGCAIGNCNQAKCNNVEEDRPSGGLNVLGFFVPVAGLVLFCVMYNRTPRKAKQIGAFALGGFVLNCILYCFIMVGGM